MRRWPARLFAAASFVLSVAILTILGEGAAWAQAKSSTLVIVVEGAPPTLKGGIGNELPAPWTQVDASSVTAAAKKRQLSAKLKALESPATRDQYTSKLAAVTTDVGGRAAVTVVVITKKNDRKGHVVLVNDAGDVLVDTVVTLAAPDADAVTLTKAFSEKLDAILHPEAAKPEPAAATTGPGSPAEAPKSDATTSTSAGATASTPGKDAPPTAPPTQPTGPERPPFVVGTVGLEFANRHLDFRDAGKSNAITEYDSGWVLTPAVAVDLFPGAGSGSKVIEDLGIAGDFTTGLAPNASWTRFDAGLKYRIWLRRDWNAPMLAPSVSYGQESYTSSGDHGAPTDKRPPVGYKMLRARVDLRVPVWKVAILAGGAFLLPFDAGDLADKFRKASELGWEADFAVTFPLTKALEVRGGIGYRRMIYWFSPQDTDPNTARGAHDQIFRPEIGVTAHL